MTLKEAKAILTGNPLRDEEQAARAIAAVFVHKSAPVWLLELAQTIKNEIYINAAADAREHNRRVTISEV